MSARETQDALQLARKADLTDEEVVRRVREGAVALYEVLMRRHNPRVYRVIRSILRDEAEVEDAMQQAYLAAFTHLDQFRGEARFSTWLLRIASREALARAQKRRKLRLVDAPVEELEREEAGAASPAFPGPPRNPEEKAMARELARAVERALDRLPEMYSAVLMLREVEGLDTAETAAALEVSEEVVKTRLHRARGMLREQLYHDLGEAASEVFPFEAPRCNRVVAAVMKAISEGRY